MSNILRFRGLYGDQHLSFVSDFIHIEPLQERSKIYSWEIKEHFHSNLIQIFIIESSEGTLFSEGKKINLKAPCVVTVPSNVLHGFNFEPKITGDVITISQSFFQTLLTEKPYITKEMGKLSCLNLKNKPEVLADLLKLKSKIQQEIFDEAPEKSLALKIYFELFYLELYRSTLRSTSEALISKNKNLAYFQQFQVLIRKHAQNLPSIRTFAKALGITQTHLNRVCHTVAGTSALKVVQDFTINEAKKYLLNTSYSISEISYFLNFNDPAYFSRLFKKRVGVPPGEFRKG
ncbi:helix-turn-helix domain-containing protein [Maribacter sp. MMG018]|uniref:helix-turn-helix domain-containing protein n=1 Tax=Maribacter sp. MMG018 TaxID=2822688 RepID=UPI001B38EB95|nr:helix-turn-helix domain-containing protein [Maribacter sp. MMG018]MBQ4913264.1 helix-turn-helix domain-containing protein [Maribacter sp. MMG018]